MIYKLIARHSTTSNYVRRGSGNVGSQFKKWTYLSPNDLKRYRGREKDYRNIEKYDLEVHKLIDGLWYKCIDGDVQDLLDWISNAKERTDQRKDNP